jgi:thymidylate synthase ThyX
MPKARSDWEIRDAAWASWEEMNSQKQAVEAEWRARHPDMDYVVVTIGEEISRPEKECA